MKERILDIAFKHFTQYGFARTTLTGIAGLLGKRKTALYYYFKNKEEIFAAIVSVEAENLLDELAKILQKDMDEVECLRSYISKRIREMHHVATRYKVLKDELFFLLPEIEKAREPFHQKEVAMVRNVLERGIRKGTIRMLDAELVAPVIVNTLKGLEIPMYVKNELKYDSVEIGGFLNLLLFGVVNHENTNQNSANEKSIHISA